MAIPPDCPQPGKTRCRVLVVDDHSDTTTTTAMLVELWGHDVQVAHDGPNAIEVAKAYRPHVILLDIGVPGLSGLEVAKQLRQDPAFRQTLLVAVTGYATAEDRRRCELAGFDCHLAKPPDPLVLEALLASTKVDDEDNRPLTIS
jgi:CheY-like chemotaxis protein